MAHMVWHGLDLVLSCLLQANRMILELSSPNEHSADSLHLVCVQRMMEGCHN